MSLFCAWINFCRFYFHFVQIWDPGLLGAKSAASVFAILFITELVRSDGFFYRFIFNVTVSTRARNICQESGMYLVSITSRVEQFNVESRLYESHFVLCFVVFFFAFDFFK